MSYEFINENNLIYQFDEIEFVEENKEKILTIFHNYDYNYYYDYNYDYNYYYYYNYYYNDYYNYYNYYYDYYSIEEILFVILSCAYFQDQLDRTIANSQGASYEID